MPFLLGIIGALLIMFYVSRRSASVTDAHTIPSDDLFTFSTSLSKTTVFQCVIDHALMSRLDMEKTDEAQGKIVLGARMNLLTNPYGYWLFIDISRGEEKATQVSIGIKSKAIQPSYLMNRLRDKFAQLLQSSIDKKTIARIAKKFFCFSQNPPSMVE